MTTFVTAPTVGVGGNNPVLGVVAFPSNFNPSGVPVNKDRWTALFATINNGTQRPQTGQIFPLGNFYGGVPSLMSALEGVAIATLGTTSTTVPSTTTEVKIRLWAKGGDGGAGLASASGGGGGGGGGYCEGIYPVVPGSTLSTVLSSTGSSSVTGMTSGTCSATKGANGSSSSTFGAGGGGGSGSGGAVNVDGLHGLGAIPVGASYISGAGGGAFCTNGGGTVMNFAGSDGQSPGGGGGGGSGANGGGTGGAPLCIIEWVQ